MKKTGIQMFEKNTYNHANKCMKKPRIQMNEKNQHAKCMKKTCEQKCFWGGVMTVDTALVVCSAEGGGRKG